jgi:hypothetical protein
MIPWWLQYLQAFALVAIPAIGVWLAWQQVQIARAKLQHDLYDRRYRVFDTTRKLLSEIVIHQNPSHEDLREFVRGIGDATFLFDTDLTRYLADLQRRALDMYSIHELMNMSPLDAQREFSIRESENFLWLVEQLDTVVDKFKPFLQLDKKQG